MRPRVGHIQFLNCLPLYYGLVKGSGILDLDLVKGTPTELNACLIAGELDVSPVSSIEYARHAADLLLLPGPTVSCRGPVRSILLLSKVPAGELHGRTVALTRASATAHVLLKILMERRFGARPRYTVCGTDLEEALREAEAALLIGDAALAQAARPPVGLHLLDLGQEWRALAGGGMVFAVWAVRRDFAARASGLVSHVWRLFQESQRWSREHLDAIALDAARWERFPAAFLEEYFRGLTFDFAEDLRRDLAAFCRAAREIGELEGEAKLEFFETEHEVYHAIAPR